MSKSASEFSVGVCIFAYNEENHILETIESVSSWGNHHGYVSEICVVDDGSTDNTASLVQEQMQLNATIQLIRHPVNRGPTEALRTGLGNMTSEYVLLLPGDYTYDRDAIAKLFTLRRRTAPSQMLILGSRDSSRARRSVVRELAAALALLPFHFYGMRAKKLPSIGLILFPRTIGLLMPKGVAGYGQGIGLLGTLFCAQLPFAAVEVGQVSGSESRGSRLTGRKIWDVLVTHWSLLRARNQIREASLEVTASR